ncbi:hypothetical protein HZS_7299 [Henneguya salminicola]|nr:hypothetical protein HZS_7299 [Henneguya salminicola]
MTIWTTYWPILKHELPPRTVTVLAHGIDRLQSKWEAVIELDSDYSPEKILLKCYFRIFIFLFSK